MITKTLVVKTQSSSDHLLLAKINAEIIIASIEIWNNNSRQSSQCWNLPHILRPGRRHGRVDNQPLHQRSILQSPCPRRWRLCQADCQGRGWEVAPETRPVATLKQIIHINHSAYNTEKLTLGCQNSTSASSKFHHLALHVSFALL